MDKPDQIFITKPYASTRVIDLSAVPNKALRVYRDSPYTITVQVRTNTHKQGRISQLTITKSEAVALSAYLARKAEELAEENTDPVIALGYPASP